MKRRKNYESPASLQQVEVLLELAFVESNVNNGLSNGGVYSSYQEKGESINLDDNSSFDGWGWD